MLSPRIDGNTVASHGISAQNVFSAHDIFANVTIINRITEIIVCWCVNWCEPNGATSGQSNAELLQSTGSGVDMQRNKTSDSTLGKVGGLCFLFVVSRLARPHSHSHPKMTDVFKGIVAACEFQKESDMKEASGLVRSGGGKVRRSPTASCTHYVTDMSNLIALQTAQTLKIPTVTIDWLIE